MPSVPFDAPDAPHAVPVFPFDAPDAADAVPFVPFDAPGAMAWRSTPAAAWGLPKTEEEEHHTAHEQNVKVYTLTRVTSGRSTRKRKCHLEAMAVVTSALGGLLAVVAGCWLVA